MLGLESRIAAWPCRIKEMISPTLRRFRLPKGGHLALGRCPAEFDADFAEQTEGWDASDEDEDVVVVQGQLAVGRAETDGGGGDFEGLGLEDQPDLAALDELGEAFFVFLLDSEQPIFAVREGHPIAGLAGQTHGSFDGAITTADTKDVLPAVLGGVADLVCDLG